MTERAHWLPRYDYSEHHENFIAVDPARVRRALGELDIRYWRVIRIGIGAIRMAALRALRRTSEEKVR